MRTSNVSTSAGRWDASDAWTVRLLRRIRAESGDVNWGASPRVQDISPEYSRHPRAWAASAPPTRRLRIPVPGATLDGDLALPEGTPGLVVFVHGSGSSRFSVRNRFVASRLQAAGIGTLLMDLLTPEEEAVDVQTRRLRFDIGLLAERVVATVDHLRTLPETADLRLGLFGSSTGAAAALVAASERADEIDAVVSRGGRPDLAGSALASVRAPSLLVVGGWDGEALVLNEEARRAMSAPTELVVVAEATHLFEEPGKLEEVAGLAARFFRSHLRDA